MKISFNQLAPNNLRFKEQKTVNTLREAKDLAKKWIYDTERQSIDNSPYGVALYPKGAKWVVVDGKDINDIPHGTDYMLRKRCKNRIYSTMIYN